MRKVTWRRFDQSAKQLVVGQTTIGYLCILLSELTAQQRAETLKCSELVSSTAPEPAAGYLTLCSGGRPRIPLWTPGGRPLNGTPSFTLPVLITDVPFFAILRAFRRQIWQQKV